MSVCMSRWRIYSNELLKKSMVLTFTRNIDLVQTGSHDHYLVIIKWKPHKNKYASPKKLDSNRFLFFLGGGGAEKISIFRIIIDLLVP